MPEAVKGDRIEKLSLGRESVYEWFESRIFTWGEIANLLVFLEHEVFDNARLRWSTAYGGEAWATSADKAWCVAHAIKTRDFKKAVTAVNALENAAHNGGWLFNKFAEKVWFDLATSGLRYGQNERHGFAIAHMAEEILEGAFAMRKDFRSRCESSVDEIIEEARTNPIDAYAQSPGTTHDSTSTTADSPGAADGTAVLAGSDDASPSESQNGEEAPHPSPKELDPAGYEGYKGLIHQAFKDSVIGTGGFQSLLDQSPGLIRDGDAEALALFAIQREKLQYLRRFARPKSKAVQTLLENKSIKHFWSWELGAPIDLGSETTLEHILESYDADALHEADGDLQAISSLTVLKSLGAYLRDGGFISPREHEQLWKGQHFSKTRVVKVLHRVLKQLDPSDELWLFEIIKLQGSQKKWIKEQGYFL